MIAFYCNGAGLGHLSRCIKVIQTLNITGPCIVFTNSLFIQPGKPFEALLRYCQAKHINLVPLQLDTATDQPTFLGYFIALLAELQVKELYIDCFPVGIYGELNGLTRQIPKLKTYLLARLIKWDVYQSQIHSDNYFSHVFYGESVASKQRYYYQQVSDNQQLLDLMPIQDIPATRSIEKINKDLPYCLIVHSGAINEISQLIDYVLQKIHFLNATYQLILATPGPVPEHYQHVDIHTIQCYPLTDWFKEATVIATGAGFNLMNEVKYFDAQHWVLPFERKYDDQFSRLVKYRGS